MMKHLLAFAFTCGIIGLSRSIKCDQDKIPCPVVDKCIPSRYFCDNDIADCNDGTDEEFCTSDKEASRENYLKGKGLKSINNKPTCILPGYVYLGTRNYCEDIDECSSPLLNNCGQLTCVNKPGSFACDCGSGYLLSENGKYCEDIDECASSPCSDYCMNTNGSFHCLCQTGYRIKNLVNCTDIDECENNPCSHICTNNDGGFKCSCQNGYSLADDASSCVDNNECGNSSLNNCEQICLNNQGSFSCACNKGFVLAENEITCNDIDECLEVPRKCSQTCLNNVGNFTCECVQGYVMPEGIFNVCLAKEGNTKTVYFTENNDIILKIMETGSKFNLTRRANVVLKRHFYSASTREVLWLEAYSSGGAILSLRLGQEKPWILLEMDDGNPEDMAIDTITKKLYVTDSEFSSVIVYDMFDASRKIHLNISTHSPTTIVVDSTNRFFYYVNLGQHHRGIYKSRMDGIDEGSVPFITSDVGRPSDMFLDDTTALLYWADSLLNKIEMVSLDGKIRKVLVAVSSSPLLKEPMSISIYEDNLYWSQRNSRVLYSSNKRKYNETKTIASESDIIIKVLVTSSSDNEFLTIGNNSCDLKNCEQMCLLGSNDTTKCVCFTGFAMNDNGTMCIPTSSNHTVDGKQGRNLQSAVAIHNESNTEHEEKIDYESLKQTAEVNLLRTLVEKTQDLVKQIDKFKISTDSQ